MAAGPIAERNQDATIYVGGLDEKVTDPILWELFLQAGPVVNVHMPKDRITQTHQGYGFVEFMGEDDADYAIKIMNMIKLYGKPIRVNKASAHQKNLDVGANLFIGNLDPEVDEKLLYDTFSAFGVILQIPKIMRDPETGNSKGFAFINFASFEAADAALEAMNGQYLCNRAITISYAFKKDSKGERHGSAAERLLAAQNPLSHADRPHQLFADAPPLIMPMVPPPPPPAPGMGIPPPGMPPMVMPPAPLGMPMPSSGMTPQGPGLPHPPMPPSGMPLPPFMPPPPFMHHPPPGMGPHSGMGPNMMPRPPPPMMQGMQNTSGDGNQSIQQQQSQGLGPRMPPPPPPHPSGGMQNFGGQMGHGMQQQNQQQQQHGGPGMGPPMPGMQMQHGQGPMGMRPPPPQGWRGPPPRGMMPPSPFGRPPLPPGGLGGMPGGPGGMPGGPGGMPGGPGAPSGMPGGPGRMPPPPPGPMQSRGPPPPGSPRGPMGQPPPPRGMSGPPPRYWNNNDE